MDTGVPFREHPDLRPAHADCDGATGSAFMPVRCHRSGSPAPARRHGGAVTALRSMRSGQRASIGRGRRRPSAITRPTPPWCVPQRRARSMRRLRKPTCRRRSDGGYRVSAVSLRDNAGSILCIVIPGWSEGPDPESRDSPMCNCTSEVPVFDAPRNDKCRLTSQ
jgi:hypothetical protein